ncbi:alpha-hydroxy-acid oxidizing protein [Bradyrhizobium genosp. P]|uniref:alpha-hydroxy-acid oxidizing protein n=1 Tax=Bradyrhizobium genosp. P TaxID=83641 RepID=UPI003CF85658
MNGRRERDLRSGFAIPFRYGHQVILDAALHPSWTIHQMLRGIPRLANFEGEGQSIEVQAALMRRQMDASFSWDDLKRLRDAWPGTLIVKGVLAETDAAGCARVGVDGVVLSNYGGRHLDDVVAPVEVLPSISATSRTPILVDSGFRRGSDVVKAIALGARAVMIGRAVLFGLAARGEAGVSDVLRMLREELDTTLALLGCRSCGELTRHHIADKALPCVITKRRRNLGYPHHTSPGQN